MNKKILISLISVVIFSNFLMAGCGKEKPQVPQQKQEQKQKAKTETKETKEVSKESLQKTLESQQKEILSLKEEVNYYKKYVQDITKTLPEEKIQLLLNKEWIYSLGVNKINFSNDGILEISDSNFELILSQEKAKYSVLPQDLSEKMKLSKELVSNINIEGDFKVNAEEKTEDNITTVTYSFKDIPSGNIIKIKLSDELKTKLGLNTNQLQVKIK